MQEFVGSHTNQVETNYYSKNQNDHTHGKTHQLSFSPQSGIHKYAIDWTPSYITWSIDGTIVRTATPDQSPGTWPQTPAQIHLGTWPGGASDQSGTVDWSGGPVDWSQAPFTAIYKSVKITDYGGGYTGAKEYVWTDHSGVW